MKIIDLRKPNFVDTELMSGKPTQVAAMVTIKGDTIYLFHWGHEGNVEDWKDVCSKTGSCREMMVLTKRRNLLLPDSFDDTKWSGKRNVWSDDVPNMVRIMKDANLIDDRSKIYIGNWARRSGEYIGIAKNIIGRNPDKLPNKMIFYHGTSSDRLELIRQYGLKPVSLELRPWKSDKLKNHPEYREHAVYMTVDKNQAHYYALKAMKVARRHKISGVKPILLKITVPKSNYKYLLPDDDYLQKQLLQLGVTWLDSVKNFGQVAYLGNIPPDWIKIESENSDYTETPIKEHITLKSLLREIQSIKTLKGSLISRYKNNVGKRIGSQIYVHKDYADEIIPKKVLENAKKYLKNYDDTFEYNSIMFDVYTHVIRFDESPDFDKAREPHVGKYITIHPDGKIGRVGKSSSIWHHKWLWVKDDYKGFDIQKSKEWSKAWTSKLPQIAKGTDSSWNSQLKKFHILESLEFDELDDIQGEENILKYLNEKGIHPRVVQLTDSDRVIVFNHFIIDDMEWPRVEEFGEWIYKSGSYYLRTKFEVIVEEQFNKQFWQRPEIVYHGTKPENVDGIMKHGLLMKHDSRVMSNQHINSVVFSSIEYHETDPYGPVKIQINTIEMKKDGFTPHVGPEPGYMEKMINELIAYRLGIKDFEHWVDSSENITQSTVLFFDKIPPKYLKVMD